MTLSDLDGQLLVECTKFKLPSPPANHMDELQLLLVEEDPRAPLRAVFQARTGIRVEPPTFHKSHRTAIGAAVRTVMSRSSAEHRLTSGVVECARQLETEPDDIMMCILPEMAAQNVCMKIQHTLIQAYCREYEIPVLKVDSVSSITEIFKMPDTKKVSTKSKVTDNYNATHALLERKQSNTRDFSCFLIKNPDEMSSDENMLNKFCKTLFHKEITIEIPG